MLCQFSYLTWKLDMFVVHIVHENWDTCHLLNFPWLLMNLRDIKASKIHLQICRDYGKEMMSDSMALRWVKCVKIYIWWTEQWTILVNDNVVCVSLGWIGSLECHSCTFSMYISHSLLHEIVSETLNYQKLCACWVPKTRTEADSMLDPNVVWVNITLCICHEQYISLWLLLSIQQNLLKQKTWHFKDVTGG